MGNSLSAYNRNTFRAMKALTYTILVKAVTDALLLLTHVISADLVIIIWIASFINIVACVISLVGMISLSGNFTATFRIMITVLILECVKILTVALGIRLSVNGYEEAANIMGVTAMLSLTVDRLLIGAAFLFLMKGYGDVLREEKIDTVRGHEQLGTLYLCCYSAFAIMAVIESKVAEARYIVLAVGAVCVVLEIMMFLRSASAVSAIWRKHTYLAADREIIAP